MRIKFKLNIRQRILLWVLAPTVILNSIAFLYVSNHAREHAYELTIDVIDSRAKQYAQRIERWLNEDLAVTRTLAAAFQEYRNLPTEEWLVLFRNMYNHVILNNKHVDAYWDSWELKNLDPNWDKDYGRYFYIVYHKNGVLTTKSEMRSMNGNSELYEQLISHPHEMLDEPYMSEMQGVTMATLSSPVRYNNKHIGLVAADITLTRFQNLVNKIKPYPSSNAFLISYGGNFVAHHDTAIFGHNINDCLPEFNKKHDFLAKVQKGEAFHFVDIEQTGRQRYYSVIPVEVGESGTPWALGISVLCNDLLAKANRSYNVGLIAALIFIVIVVAIIWFVADSIAQPIKHITLNLKALSHGKVDRSMLMEATSNDEIGQMAQAFSDSVQGFIQKTEFARQIGEGNLQADVALLSDDDVLGRSLIEMRDNLRKAQQEEQQHQEEAKQSMWINEGLAKFGEILRQNNDNMELLCDDVIKNLVWYLKASLGGIFMAQNDGENITYEMISAFAYDRKRFIQKSYQQSEGLIGACASERDIIQLTEIPQDYIEITSGLGDTNPNFLFLVPLINDEEVLGVIELASLQRFNDNEVKFVKEVARSIASTLQTVKVNSLTSKLLDKSKEQAEILAAQEEEMRQNLEELQATQEEASRKSTEFESFANALNETLYLVEYDLKGMVININDTFLEALGAKRDDILGTHVTKDMVMSEHDNQNFDRFWEALMHGQTRKRTATINCNGTICKLFETYTAVKNEMGDIYKILKIGVDITKQ